MGYNLSSLNKSATKPTLKAMIYTDIHLYWGELIVDENQIAGRLLTGASLPDNVCLVNNKYMNSKHMGTGIPITVNKSFIPIQKILGFHLVDSDEKEFVPEDNRIEKVVVLLLGNFKISASIWIGSKINLAD